MSDLSKLLYSKDEAAEMLSVSRWTIEWLLRKGKLPRRKIAGKIQAVRVVNPTNEK